MVAAALLTARVSGQSPIQWHGYGQMRYTRSSSAAGFSLRRAKLWMTTSVPDVAALSFKVQGVFRNAAQGAFVLQDFFAEYHGRVALVRVGQMVPDFSLERSQPDYLIPLAERAAVVDALVPGATTLARDIGVQVSLAQGGSPVHLSAGLFNGSGANHVNTARGNFLATARATYTHELGADMTGTAGGSIEMRSTDGTNVGVLSPTGSPFVGHELRWGTEARLVARRWTLQGEYLEGHLGDDVSRGFYVLGTWAVSPADEAAFSVERLRTPRPDESTTPWYIVAWDHLLTPRPHDRARAAHPPNGSGRATPTKTTIDVRIRPEDGNTVYQATLQLQVFLH